MAAAVACWLKAYYPAIRIVGEAGCDQPAMRMDHLLPGAGSSAAMGEGL